MDKLNIVTEAGGAQAGTEFEFMVGKVPAIEPPEMRAFALVRFPRADLLTDERMLAEAARLVI
jgi:hypothetical protein